MTQEGLHSFAWYIEDVVKPYKKCRLRLSDEEEHESIEKNIGLRAGDTQSVILSKTTAVALGGEMVAIIGPSGSGKSTLLSILFDKNISPLTSPKKGLYVNAKEQSDLRRLAAYVKQDDDLCGSLTVYENIDFSSRLARSLDPAERHQKNVALLEAFGMGACMNQTVGIVGKMGISGGQKRRLSLARELVKEPKILFLDEVTSGLAHNEALNVIRYVRQMCKQAGQKRIALIAIHQPSQTILDLFDRILLLRPGMDPYYARLGDIRKHFGNIPPGQNPAEYLAENLDEEPRDCPDAQAELDTLLEDDTFKPSMPVAPIVQPSRWASIGNLIHRCFLKSYRDPVAYWIRFVMNVALAILMGTVWLRLSPNQDNIQAFINALFFGAAFMPFMSVAYIPAFLEDRRLFIHERDNGHYTASTFILANFLTGVPYLFGIAITFSTLLYWLVNLRPAASGFFRFILWLFLDLLAAESMVVLISSLTPIFVVALAVTAFANAVWMCSGGFLVKPQTLNPFWRYVFHYINYQSYVFQGMMVNEFGERKYTCNGSTSGDETCPCVDSSEGSSSCFVDGKTILKAYGYDDKDIGSWVVIMISIIVIFRMLSWLALRYSRA